MFIELRSKLQRQRRGEKMKMRQYAKHIVNCTVATLGARVVNAEWGPRGFQAAFRQIARTGWAPATVLDIGASTGSWSRECMSIFPLARYFLAEPLEYKREALKSLASADNRVRYFLGGIGSMNGQLELNDNDAQSSFFPSHDFHGVKRSVPVRTLDSFRDEFGFQAPMLLKADVQGFELEVLEGARECLPFVDVMLLEVSFRRIYDNGPLAHEVIAYAGMNGFRMYDFVSYMQRDSDGALLQTEIVFVRDGSKLFNDERAF